MTKITKAMENALYQIQYYNDWMEILDRLYHDLNDRYGYSDEERKDLCEHLHALKMFLMTKELDAWRRSFMFALGMNEETRKRIMHHAKQRFLDPDDTHHYAIGHLLHPLNKYEGHVRGEEEFRQELREYFKLDEGQ